MRKIASAAAAVIMGACAFAGVVGKAEAFSISVSGSGIDAQDGNIDFSLAVDDKAGSFSYNYENITFYDQLGPYTYRQSSSGTGTSYVKIIRDHIVVGIDVSVYSNNALINTSQTYYDGDGLNDSSSEYYGQSGYSISLMRDTINDRYADTF